MDSYTEHIRDYETFPSVVSYLCGAAQKGWIVCKESDDGGHVKSWKVLKIAPVSYFDTLNNGKIARDKLARWRQVKNV